jgi:hypothetical protein
MVLSAHDKRITDHGRPPSMCPFEEDWRFPCGWCGTTLEGEEDKVLAHMEVCPHKPEGRQHSHPRR